MASVYRPAGRKIHRIEFIDQRGQTRTVSSGMRNKVAAESLAQKLERDAQLIRAGELPEHPDITGEILGLTPPGRAKPWEEAVQEYLSDLVRRGSPKGGRHYGDCKKQLEKLGKECEWTQLGHVNAEDFTAFLDGLTDLNRAPRTINKYHQCLSAFLAWCMAPPRLWLRANPIEGLARAKAGKAARRRLRRPYTPQDWATLLEKAPAPRLVVYQVAAFSGLRRSELRRLQKQDFTPVGEKPRWHLRPEVSKNGLPWNLPMLRECAEVLRPIWERLPHPTSLVFGAGRGEGMGKRGQPRKDTGPGVPKIETLYEDLKVAGIAQVDERGRHADFHSFRYFFCKTLGQNLPIQAVKKYMRHLTLQMTADLYMDLEMEDLEEELGALPALFQTKAGDNKGQGKDGKGEEAA